MFFFVIACLLIIVGIGLASKGRLSYGGESWPVRAAGFTMVAIGMLIVGFMSIFRLSVGEAAVLQSFTGTVREQPVVDPGMHFKAPWDSVETWNTRNLVINFGVEAAKQEDTETVTNDGPITSSTSDGASFDFDETVTYSIDASSVVKIFNEYKTQQTFTNMVVLPGARAASRNAPTTFVATNIRNERPKLSGGITKDLVDRFNAWGVQISSVDVRELRLPKEIVDNLNAVQTRLAEVEKTRAELANAQLQAEITKTQAKAQSDSDQIIRCGAEITEGNQTVNGQTTKVVIVTPVAQDKCQNRLNEQVLMSKYIDMLTKAAEKGSTIYVVPPGTNNLLQLQQTQPSATK